MNVEDVEDVDDVDMEDVDPRMRGGGRDRHYPPGRTSTSASALRFTAAASVITRQEGH